MLPSVEILEGSFNLFFLAKGWRPNWDTFWAPNSNMLRLPLKRFPLIFRRQVIHDCNGQHLSPIHQRYRRLQNGEMRDWYIYCAMRTLMVMTQVLVLPSSMSFFSQEFSVQLTYREQWNDERLKFTDLEGKGIRILSFLTQAPWRGILTSASRVYFRGTLVTLKI